MAKPYSADLRERVLLADAAGLSPAAVAKILRSLALKGRRFETWPEIEEAIRRATTYWNAHKHPFI